MKPGRIIGILLGAALVIVAVGAYFSGEPASQTQNGRIAILFAAIMGVFMIAGNSSAGKKQEAPIRQPAPAPAPPVKPLCPACGRQISSEYLVCPYCGKRLREKCPSCGKDVAGDFIVCPYCGISLKSGT
jgi:DNA-directed RNA polymerase subunit RPC12/RpoP